MISTIVPKLPYITKQPTIQFYELLGFSLRSDYGDYLIMDFVPCELHFFSYPTLQPGKSDFMIYLRIDSEIEKLYRKIQESGIAIHPNGKLSEKPWKQKEFSILDPNGTLLTFGQGF
jgi:hypothetical protein